MKHAGGGKNTGVAGEKTVKRDFLALVGEHIKSEAARLYKNNTRTFVSVVNCTAFSVFKFHSRAQEGIPVVLTKALPKWKAILK